MSNQCELRTKKRAAAKSVESPSLWAALFLSSFFFLGVLKDLALAGQTASNSTLS